MLTIGLISVFFLIQFRTPVHGDRATHLGWFPSPVKPFGKHPHSVSMVIPKPIKLIMKPRHHIRAARGRDRGVALDWRHRFSWGIENVPELGGGGGC